MRRWVVHISKDKEYFLFTCLHNYDYTHGISIKEHPEAYQKLLDIALDGIEPAHKSHRNFDNDITLIYDTKVSIFWPGVENHIERHTHEEFLAYLYDLIEEDKLQHSLISFEELFI